MTTYDEIMQEFKQDLAHSDIYEYVDNYVPIYNNEVIKEWQDMPSDYDNRGSAELGHNCDELNIVSLMQADLYLYYQDIVALVLDDLQDELESVA